MRCDIIKDRKTKRSRGFGFVIFASPFDAEKAIKANKNELRFGDRVMTLSWAEKKKGSRQDTGQKSKEKIKEVVEMFSGSQCQDEGEDSLLKFKSIEIDKLSMLANKQQKSYSNR